MNKFDDDFKRYLQFGKLANSLTQEEEADFEYLLANDSDFGSTFHSLTQKFSPEVLEHLSLYKQPEEWENITDHFVKKPFIRQYWMGTTALACVAIALITWLAINPGNTPALTAKSGDEQKTVELKLADGEMINLSNTQGTIATKSGNLFNSNRALSYSTHEQSSVAMNTLIVAPGLDYHIVLSDGTKVWLNSETKLEFPFTFPASKRAIKISGEAYLEVAKDPARPFIVTLPNSVVEVLGTSFNVNSYDNGINKISLVEGSVNVKANNSMVTIQPGLEAIFDQGKNEMRKQKFNAHSTLSWREGLIYFEEAPLSEIIKVIRRWYGANVIIDNSRNDNVRFVGIINKKNKLETFLNNLSYVSGVESYYDEAGALHFK